jgi:hypothetical protein
MKNTRAVLIVATLCCATSICALSQNGLKQLAVLKPSNAGGNDFFGSWVSASANVITTNCDGGECIFVKPISGWRSMRQTATLTASDGSVLFAPSISGNTVAATAEDGAVYVFVEPNTGWADMTETAKLTTSDGNVMQVVAINGNTIVGGSEGATVGLNQPGAAYVFVEPAAGWTAMTQTAKLWASDGITGDNFGYSVATSGGTIVAGARNASINNGSGQGAAYVFVEPSGGWANATETGKLTASDGSDGAGLGWSASANGNTIVAGAPFQQQAEINGPFVGAAYVFSEPQAGWGSMTETARLSPTNGVNDGAMGWSVAVGGNLIVAGSPGTQGINKRQAAYEFLKPAAGWQSATQNAALSPQKAPAYAEFGYGVSVSGSTVVVGAPGSGYTNNQGLVYVFGP